MNRLKISSALFVSSPYHMRRIKLISDAVPQNSGAAIAFVPSRFEKTHPLTWWLRPAEIVWVGSEFAKIAWFILYHHAGLIPTANG